MDIYEAAQLLGVAAHEISAVERDAEGWVAVHEDMASHVTTRRRVPGTAPDGQAEEEPPAEDGSAPQEPAAADEAPATRRKRAPKKAAGDDAAGA